MIARVRIAPVEQWCEVALKIAGKDRKVFLQAGKEVLIIIDDVRTGHVWECGGREWQMEETCALARRAEMGKDLIPSRWWICEHMLEMD